MCSCTLSLIMTNLMFILLEQNRSLVIILSDFTKLIAWEREKVINFDNIKTLKSRTTWTRKPINFMPIIIISRLYKAIIIQGRSQEFTERVIFLVVLSTAENFVLLKIMMSVRDFIALILVNSHVGLPRCAIFTENKLLQFWLRRWTSC